MSQSQFEMVIGLEVHAQLNTKTKLFCGCSTQFGSDVNTNVCPVCLGMPGSLPVLNASVVKMAVQAGLALHCDIQLRSVFARKNYFYPDLPKGYQISQFDLPICLNGFLDIEVEGIKKRIGITRIHIEEDAGKLLHQGAEAIAGSTHSLVDLNRACTPLIEIVSEPDIRSGAEARAYVETLRQVLRTIGVNDGNLEEGSMRVDVNLSLRKPNAPFGTRTEVKNVNSFRSIERAIASEYRRQEDLLLSGGTVIQQTRNYHDDTQTTTPLRDKEDAHDYRYFPEPDLLPLVLTQSQIADIATHLPPLPDAILERYTTHYGLSRVDFDLLIEETDMRHFFESCVGLLSNTPSARFSESSTTPLRLTPPLLGSPRSPINRTSGAFDNSPSEEVSPRELCKWIIGDLNASLKDQGGFSRSKVTPAHLVRLVSLILDGTISGKMAKDVLTQVVATGASPDDVVASMGGGQISDTSALIAMVKEVLDHNQDVVEKVKAGKTASANFLMGQVMKLSQGKAKPDLVLSLIMDDIASRSGLSQKP
jgi:aspartyl-tRNA(Asn)/glutamyl-tRNA(Gln) amidotransferase subunit B